jgi:hypothetical protein
MQTTFCLYVLVLFSVSVGVCHGHDGLGLDPAYTEKTPSVDNFSMTPSVDNFSMIPSVDSSQSKEGWWHGKDLAR